MFALFGRLSALSSLHRIGLISHIRRIILFNVRVCVRALYYSPPDKRPKTSMNKEAYLEMTLSQSLRRACVVQAMRAHSIQFALN